MEISRPPPARSPPNGRPALGTLWTIVLLVACWARPESNFQLPHKGSHLPLIRQRQPRTQRAALGLKGSYRKKQPPPTGFHGPLPWPTETAEIMIDAHSVIPWFWRETAKIEKDLNLRHDKFAFWPARIVKAGEALRARFGLDRPPSPWSPIIAVFDLPDPGNTWNGQQIKRYRKLSRQGPRTLHNNVTLAFSQTYVDTSNRENYRADREIVYMLEMLSRPYPRRQILVTQDMALAREAEEFCLIRSARWFNKELLKSGERGRNASEALLSIEYDFQSLMEELELPNAVQLAFASR